MVNSDDELRELVGVIVAGDAADVARWLSATPGLARASFKAGATRQTARAFFLNPIGRYIYRGDTGLHIASAAYQTEIARQLLAAGADVHARNRRGQEALHFASVGNPGSPQWNPAAQDAVIRLLIGAGADPNVLDKDGVSPLHKAVRTRCGAAVRALLDCGADPAGPNKSGSTPMLLATQNTGRGGSGSAAAKTQRQKIVLLLDQALRRGVAKS